MMHPRHDDLVITRAEEVRERLVSAARLLQGLAEQLVVDARHLAEQVAEEGEGRHDGESGQ